MSLYDWLQQKTYQVKYEGLMWLFIWTLMVMLQWIVAPFQEYGKANKQIMQRWRAGYHYCFKNRWYEYQTRERSK